MKRKRTKVKGPVNTRYLAYSILLLILLVSAVYAFTHYEGPSGYGDDIVYANLAENLLQGNFHESVGFIFSARLMAFAPVAFFLLFGPNALTASLWNILSYLGLTVVAFYFTRMFYSYKEGLIAAFLVGIFPLATKFAVTVGEDMPLAFVISLCVLLFLYGERNASRRMYLASGVLLVVSWLISYEAGVAILFLALYALVEVLRGKIRVDRNSMFFVYGIVLALLVVLIYSYYNSGMPFFTITENFGFYSAVGTSVRGTSTIPSTNTNLMFYPNIMFQYRFISMITHSNAMAFLPNLIKVLFPEAQVVEYGLYFYLAFLSAIVLLVLRDRRAFFMLSWFAFFVAFLEFGPMSVISLHPLSFQYLLSYRLGRFMLVATVPMAAVIAAGMGKLLDFRNRYLLAVGAVVLATVLLLLFVQNYQIENYWYEWQMYPQSMVMQAANYLRGAAQNSTIYMEILAPNGALIGPMTAFWVYYGNYNVNNRISFVGNSINCTDILNDSYVVWSGAPACSNWIDVYNVTVPSSIPQYIVTQETPNIVRKITNVYYVE